MFPLESSHPKAPEGERERGGEGERERGGGWEGGREEGKKGGKVFPLLLWLSMLAINTPAGHMQGTC